MFSILVLSYFFQLNLIFLLKEDFQKWRESFIKSVVVLGIFIYFSTEVLSFFTALNSKTVLIWWITGNLILSIYIAFDGRKNSSLTKFSDSLRTKTEWFSHPLHKVLWLLFSTVYLIVLIIALFAPPNTADGMTYHLPRVAHWVQNGSIDFYQTSIERQLYNGPFAEFAILHLQLLSGSDQYANLVQFFSFICCGIAVSLIAQKFKLNILGQLLAVFIVSTIPMAILQGSSVKNDLVASLFIILFFYFYLKATETSLKSDFLFAGFALGLALLTKANAYFICFPIGVLFFIKYFFSKDLGKNKLGFLLKTFAILLLAFLINSTHYFRTWQLYGTPVKGEERLKNEAFSLPILSANLIRNCSVHLASSYGQFNQLTKETVINLLGEEINNPKSTVDNQQFSVTYSDSEDSAGNLFHFLLLIFSIIYLFFYRGGDEKINLIISITAIFLGFLIFCSLLKWNVWVSRLHLPFFILACPLIAVFISSLDFRKITLLALLCFISSISVLLFGAPRSLITSERVSVLFSPRTEQYFDGNPPIKSAYQEAADFIKQTNAQEVGLDLSVDYSNYRTGDWEYIFWVLLKNQSGNQPVLRHVGINNPSKSLEKNIEMPEWVLSTKNEKSNIIDNTEYVEVWTKAPVRVLHKKDISKN